MPLKAVVENLDGVAAELHALYVERDGKFVLDIDQDSIRVHPNVTALSNALTAQKEDNRKVKARVAELEAKIKGLPEDFDPAEVETLRERVAELEAAVEGDPKSKEKQQKEAARLREMLDQKMASERKKWDTEKADLQRQISERDTRIARLLIDNGLDAAMDSANIDPKYRKAVRAMLRDQVKVVDKDGNYAAVVETDLDPELPLDRFVADWSQSDDGRAFVGQPKGGGAGGGQGSNTTKNPWSKDHWNMTEQGKLIRENPTKARQLAKEAGKQVSF